jgi:DNA replication protein
VDRHENVLVFGSVGSGKTHLLAGIAQELVRAGRKVLFTTCSLLVQELLIAKRDLKLSRVLKRLAGHGVLVIDDLGYVQQSREEMEVLFTLLAERYERGSVMLTSNLPFSQWEKIFKDAMTTAARSTAGASQCHHRVEPAELPGGASEKGQAAREQRGGEGQGKRSDKDAAGPGAAGSAPPRSASGPGVEGGSLIVVEPQQKSEAEGNLIVAEREE